MQPALSQEPGEGPPQADSVEAELVRENSYGMTPIGAYSPTYGVILGVAGFIFPKKGRQGLDSHLVLAVLPNSGQLDVSFGRTNDWTKQWVYNIEGTYNNFFTSFYGEGDRTSNQEQEFNQRFYRMHEGILFHQSSFTTFEGFLETRARTDLGLRSESADHLTENEVRSVVGLAYTHDTRNSRVNTRTGHFALAQVQTTFGGGVTPGFQQIELEFRQFYSLADSWVLGLRAEAASTNGTPSYNYDYNLGGIERLRGYLHNRFRGSQYYLGGYEVRKDVYKNYLQLVTFGDAGDVKADSYYRPRAAFGVGLRIGLPPDWDMKFRIDYAQGDDQHGIFATFAQAF